MNVIFISPHFPPHDFRFCLYLKSAGANVPGIGDESYDSLAPSVRSAPTEYYRVADLHDYDALLRACGHFTHRYGKIDRLDPLNEYWLNTEARLRDDFNIFGVRGGEIDFIRSGLDRLPGPRCQSRLAAVVSADELLFRSSLRLTPVVFFTAREPLQELM